VVRITSRMANLIQTRTPLTELRRTAREEGMKLLADNAVDKARQGLTSLEEALSITISEECQ
jgi:type IV pilus assembly protein PilB